MKRDSGFPLCALALVVSVGVGCASGDADDSRDVFGTTNFPMSTSGSGDGDGDPGDGDGDGDPSTGDGDPSTGDGDGDPSTGDGDGDPSTGDGDGEPAETCDDGLQNQDETDVDCGGASCAGCIDGDQCGGDLDCLSGQCVDGLCFTGCVADSECDALDDQCHEGVCNQGTCELAPANEAGPCSSGDLCLTNGMCSQGTCMEAQVDCTALDDQCSVGACNPMSGQCEAAVANEGMPCNDDDGCSTGDVCSGGQCSGSGGALLYEEFADNSAGWTLGTEWQIGSAVAGCGDPGTDHSPTGNNGVAGVVLGGCATTSLHGDYCLTSPVIDTLGQATVWMTYYRDLYSDYAPYMTNKIEVFNGNSWVTVFVTGGSPGVNDANWTYFAYDLTQYKNASMRVRWCHSVGSSGAFSRGSWNIDDVTIATGQCNGAD